MSKTKNKQSTKSKDNYVYDSELGKADISALGNLLAYPTLVYMAKSQSDLLNFENLHRNTFKQVAETKEY